MRWLIMAHNVQQIRTPYVPVTESDLSTYGPKPIGHADGGSITATASIMSSVVNLCNCIVGAALLGLPFAANQVGWIMSVILLIAFSLISSFTFQLLTEASMMYNASTHSLSSSYSNICMATVPRLRLFAELVIFFNNFGSMLAYLVIIGELMPDAMALLTNNDLLLNR